MLLEHVPAEAGRLSTAGDPYRADERHDVARLRLVGMVRVGDGYLVRAVGRLTGTGSARQHLDISFGDAVNRSATAVLEAAVRQVQRWCEEGTTVSLVEVGARLALRSVDGVEVTLPTTA